MEQNKTNTNEEPRVYGKRMYLLSQQEEFDEAVKAYVGPYCTFHIDIDDPSVRHIVTLPATMPSEWKLDILYKEYINLRNNANGRIHKEMPIQRRFY
jgi:hypothetical protein